MDPSAHTKPKFSHPRAARERRVYRRRRRTRYRCRRGRRRFGRGVRPHARRGRLRECSARAADSGRSCCYFCTRALKAPIVSPSFNTPTISDGRIPWTGRPLEFSEQPMQPVVKRPTIYAGAARDRQEGERQ